MRTTTILWTVAVGTLAACDLCGEGATTCDDRDFGSSKIRHSAGG